MPIAQGPDLLMESVFTDRYIVVQTRHKSRLAQGFSYPLGLQDLQKALGDLSQAAELHVSFYDCPPGAHNMQFRSSVKRDLPHQVLEAYFAKWDKQPSISNSTFTDEYLRGQWSIIVYPVASVRRSVARRLLIDALPSVRDWLSRTRPESWYYGQRVCELRFDPLEGTIAVTEIVNKI
jgi:hypothetical protein